MDLDLTLLNNNEELSPFTVSVLRKIKELGVKLVFATARAKSSVDKYSKIISPDAIISSGGALATIGDEVIYNAFIDSTNATNYIKQCIEEKSIDYIRVVGEYSDYTNNPNIDWSEMEYGHYKKTDFSHIPDQRVCKITIVSSFPECVKRMFINNTDCKIFTAYAGDKCHKLAHKSATKEDALLAVATKFGVQLKNILSFGDDVPDIGMLEISGIGVAVENAHPEVKEAANYICGSNQFDGVAKYIVRNINLFGRGHDEKKKHSIRL